MQVKLDPAKFDAILRTVVQLAGMSSQLRDTLVQWRAAADAATRPTIQVPGQQPQDPRAIAAEMHNISLQLLAATVGNAEQLTKLASVEQGAGPKIAGGD